MKRYYSTQRPVMPGSYPKRVPVRKIHNYDYRTYIEEIGRQAWGYIEYEGELTTSEIANYELVEGGLKNAE